MWIRFGDGRVNVPGISILLQGLLICLPAAQETTQQTWKVFRCPDKGLGSISLAEVLSDIELLSLDLSNLSALFYLEMLPQMISENEW